MRQVLLRDRETLEPIVWVTGGTTYENPVIILDPRVSVDLSSIAKDLSNFRQEGEAVYGKYKFHVMDLSSKQALSQYLNIPFDPRKRDPFLYRGKRKIVVRFNFNIDGDLEFGEMAYKYKEGDIYVLATRLGSSDEKVRLRGWTTKRIFEALKTRGISHNGKKVWRLSQSELYPMELLTEEKSTEVDDLGF